MEADRLARFQERLRSPQAWLAEMDDMDSMTTSHDKHHVSKARKTPAVPKAVAEMAVCACELLRWCACVDYLLHSATQESLALGRGGLQEVRDFARQILKSSVLHCRTSVVR